jgi:hypothetical protein
LKNCEARSCQKRTACFHGTNQREHWQHATQSNPNPFKVALINNLSTTTYLDDHQQYLSTTNTVPADISAIASQQQFQETMHKKVLLCGGGNAIHVLASMIGSRPDCDVSIFSTFPGEADRIRDAIPEKGIQCVNDLGEDKYGKPVKVSDKAEEVVPGSDIIILAIPSFTHELYLRAVAPFVKPGVIIGAMPGEGGFDLCARHVFGADFVNQSNIFALETLPWACRILVRHTIVEKTKGASLSP